MIQQYIKVLSKTNQMNRNRKKNFKFFNKKMKY